MEYNLTAPLASSTRCSSYPMQIITQANCQNTTAGVSNAPALESNHYSVSSMKLPQMFPANLPVRHYLLPEINWL